MKIHVGIKLNTFYFNVWIINLCIRTKFKLIGIYLLMLLEKIYNCIRLMSEIFILKAATVQEQFT